MNSSIHFENANIKMLLRCIPNHLGGSLKREIKKYSALSNIGNNYVVIFPPMFSCCCFPFRHISELLESSDYTSFEELVPLTTYRQVAAKLFDICLGKITQIWKYSNMHHSVLIFLAFFKINFPLFLMNK